MNRPAYIVFGIFLLVGVRSLSAQQVNPRVPPPPPPAETPSATSTARRSATPQPSDPTIPPPPPSDDSTPEPPAAPSGPVCDPLHAQRSIDVGRVYLRKGS